MGNFGKLNFLECLEKQEYTLDFILDKITEFNNDYGFIASYANSVRQKINSIALFDQWFDEERALKIEDILSYGDSLEKMWLEIYDYRWEEFYENNRPSASGNKIGLNIFDWELFKEFISTQTPEVSEKFYTFLFQVILDNALKSDFYWELKNWEEKNKSIYEQLEYLEDLWNITSPYLQYLIEDYKNQSLYQSLLSKFIFTNYTPELSITSLQNIQNFTVLENAWDESFKALKVIMGSESFESHHEQHLRLLAKFLKECLENTNKMIFNELMEAKKQFQEWKIKAVYNNDQHEKFITKFFNKAHARRYLIEQILAEKKDEN